MIFPAMITLAKVLGDIAEELAAGWKSDMASALLMLLSGTRWRW